MTPNTLNIPDDPDFINDLILQRTGPFIKLGCGQALNHWFQTGEKARLSSFLRKQNLLPAYLKMVVSEVEGEVETFCQYTTGCTVNSLVSIGPGNGIFELMLCQKYDFERILLIDIEYTEGLHQHGFSTNGSGYASLSRTKSFMSSNGIQQEKIFLCNPLKEKIPPFQFDILISLLSMGFHYPCNDYTDFILSNLKQNSLVILDKRKGAADIGFDALFRKLAIKQTVDGPKSSRYFLINR